MTIRPLADHVVVEPITETQTPGGIILPDSAQKKTGRGRVLAVGPGRYFPEAGVPAESEGDDAGERAWEMPWVEVPVQPGDVVLYGAYAGHREEVDGKDVLILSERDLLGVLEEGS